MHRVACLLLLAFALVGCERGFPTTGSAPTISEDQFVEAMVELRSASIRQESGILPAAERDAILEQRGLDPEDLVRFAEVHGPDVPYMLGVWSRVDSASVAGPGLPPAGGEPDTLLRGEGIDR